MDLIEQAKKYIQNENLSCFAYLKIGQYKSNYSGIRPLLQPLNADHTFFEDAILIVKVIGKSAAFLLIYGKVKKVHAMIMSEHAKNLLDKTKIEYSYDKLVPYISNNLNTGMCPMENTVIEIDDVDEAFQALNKKVDELMKKRDL